MSEVVHIKHAEKNMVSVFESVAYSARAIDKANKAMSNSAALIFDIALGIWESKGPNHIHEDVIVELDRQYIEAGSIMVTRKLMGEDWAKSRKYKNLNQAYRKVRGALEIGLNLDECTSCNDCEKKTTAFNEKIKAEAIEERQKQTAKSLSKREGISEKEALDRLKSKGIQGTIDNKKASNGERVEPKQVSSILQDKFGNDVDDTLVNMFIDQIQSLLEVASKDEDTALSILETFDDKITKAKRGLGLSKSKVFKTKVA